MKRTRSLFLSICSLAACTLAGCSGGNDTDGLTMNGDYGITATEFASGQKKIVMEGGMSFSIIPNITGANPTNDTIATGVQGVISYDAGKERVATFNYETTATDEEGNVLTATVTISNIQPYKAEVVIDEVINGVSYDTAALTDKLALLTALGYTVEFGYAGNNSSSLYSTSQYWNTISTVSMPNTIRIAIDYRSNYAQNRTAISSSSVINQYQSATVSIEDNIQLPDADEGGDATGDDNQE